MALTLTIADYVIPYLVILFNCVIFKLCRNVVDKTVPSSISLLFHEIISTIELCSDCAELGVVWEVHGNIGLSITLFLLCVWWTEVFGDAEACPCGPVEDTLLLGQSALSSTTLQKLIGQLTGAYLTGKYISHVWCWDLSEQHHALHHHACESTLLVAPLYGFGIEALITFISRIVALQSESWSTTISTLLNSSVTVGLVLFALNTTGAYFNPVMASALTYNCQGSSQMEHFAVYWGGALSGGLVARWCHINLLSNTVSTAAGNHVKSE